MPPEMRISIKTLALIVLSLIVLVETVWIIRLYHRASPAIPTRKAPVVVKGRIAVIIDDNGYNSHDCQMIASLPAPVTVSVLPELEYSKDIAACAHAHQKEVMLHLPLEPYINRENYPEDYIIKTSMTDEEITGRFHQALASVPFVAGVNNHMGSKATEDTRLISVLFEQLKKEKLFFIDSVVTGESVCPALARKTGISFSRRDIFLDNNNNRAYIEKQFALLVQKARRKGTTIGIGHARPLTWQILAEQMQRLKEEGFEFVTVSELIRAQSLSHTIR